MKTSVLLGIVTTLAVLLALSQSKPAMSAESGTANAEIIKLEQIMWDHWKAHRIDAMAQYMANDMVVVDATGVMGKDAIIAVLKKQQCNVSNAVIESAAVRSLASDTVVVTYVSRPAGVCDGVALSKTGDLVSSVWVKRDGKWLTVFHQETPAAIVNTK